MVQPMKYYKLTIMEAGVGAWIFRGHSYRQGVNRTEMLAKAFDDIRPMYPFVKIGIDSEEVTKAEYDKHMSAFENLPF